MPYLGNMMNEQPQAPADLTIAEESPTDTSPRSETANGNDQAWAIMAHLSPMVAFLLIPGPLGPLAVWLIKRGENTFVAEQAKASFNFTLSVWLCGAPFLLLGLLLMGSDIGFLAGTGRFFNLLFSIWVGLSLVFGIIGAFKAAKGKTYNYPYAFTFIE